MVAVWGGAALARAARCCPRPRGGVAALTGLVAAAGGIWLVRNAIESGSPLNPVSIPPFWDDAARLHPRVRGLLDRRLPDRLRGS